MYPNADRASKPTHFCQQSFCLNIFMARKNSISLLKSWNKLRGWSLAVIFQMGKWPQTASRLGRGGSRGCRRKEGALEQGQRLPPLLLLCDESCRAEGGKHKKPQQFALSAHALDDFVVSAFVGSAVPASASPPDVSSSFRQKLLVYVNLFCTYTLAKAQSVTCEEHDLSLAPNVWQWWGHAVGSHCWGTGASAQR